MNNDTNVAGGDPAMLVADNQKILECTNWKAEYDDLELICKSALECEELI